MKCASFDRIVTVFEKNALAVQEAKKEGKKVVGQYCLYSPSEIAVAAGAIPVSLCGTRNDSIPAATAAGAERRRPCLLAAPV